jgi:hypothetical protein
LIENTTISPLPPKVYLHYGIDGMSDEHIAPSPPLVDKRRSQRVRLSVPILVRAVQEGSEPPVTEDTTTLEVNAHGALISLAMKLRPGQRLILRNWNTGREQECRVVHVKDNPYGKNEVGISFPFADGHFWNLDFPPEDWKPYLK